MKPTEINPGMVIASPKEKYIYLLDDPVCYGIALAGWGNRNGDSFILSEGLIRCYHPITDSARIAELKAKAGTK